MAPAQVRATRQDFSPPASPGSQHLSGVKKLQLNSFYFLLSPCQSKRKNLTQSKKQKRKYEGEIWLGDIGARHTMKYDGRSWVTVLFHRYSHRSDSLISRGS
ncbi:hypothetical protein CRM22_010116 [Opisthorchis felineus]|uniref:Uncharacterized protein n=1 Tax=Opisthorchis felineus TaxID=147828 RepID=A0A4S2L7V7_OPIFE|nr:hypothetical protein CRM22_010116 [Opisthorchis felineus]